jgi:hypothetical protein
VLIGQTDSPQKKQMVTNANRVTNFKLGLSGKRNQVFLYHSRASCGCISETRTPWQLLTRSLQSIYGDPSTPSIKFKALAFWFRQPYIQEISGSNLSQGKFLRSSSRLQKSYH